MDLDEPRVSCPRASTWSAGHLLPISAAAGPHCFQHRPGPQSLLIPVSRLSATVGLRQLRGLRVTRRNAHIIGQTHPAAATPFHTSGPNSCVFFFVKAMRTRYQSAGKAQMPVQSEWQPACPTPPHLPHCVLVCARTHWP